MAVVALKGANITNLDASPSVKVDPALLGGRVRLSIDTVELANGDSIGSTYRLARIPSNANISSIRLFCDAITSGAADIGLYRTATDGGAVVDADCYATAQSIASASAVGIETAFEVRDIANAQRKVFQDAGLTSDPNVFYDVTLTLTAATTAAGTVTLRVEYTVD